MSFEHPTDCTCKICTDYVKQIEIALEKEELKKKYRKQPSEQLENCCFCGRKRDQGPPSSFSRANEFNRYCTKCLQKSNTFRSNYNLTLEQYRSIITDQEGRCAICNILLAEGGLGADAPSVDHCHESEHVRGVLCTRCNKGLGQFKDNVGTLKSAIAYLIKNRIKRTWWYQKVFEPNGKNLS